MYDSQRQIHTDYRNPIEKKGWHGHSLTERGYEGQRETPRKPAPCLDRLLGLFWAHDIVDDPYLPRTGSLQVITFYRQPMKECC